MSLAGEAARLWGQPRVRLAIAVLAFLALTTATYLIAHPKMFTGFAGYDDEGYMLTALKAFVRHGDLYDRVFTQYGPFYYEAWGGLFSLFGIPVDHDSGREVVTVVWVVVSLTLGLAAMRMTASLLLGLATQMLVFGALAVFANEPMHPGGLICLLLAAIVAISCFVGERSSRPAMAALGAAVAALILVKVNVGVFALASLALACVVSFPALARRGWLRGVVEAGFVALPLLLMAGKLGEDWVRRYALHVAIAALAVAIVLRARRRDERRDGGELDWLAAGLLGAGAAICLAILAAGTSPAGLIEGVISQPLRQSDVFTIPLGIAPGFFAVDLLALVGAAGYLYASRHPALATSAGFAVATSLLALAVGLAMAPSVAGKTFPFSAGGPLNYPLSMLDFCWVALIGPPSGTPARIGFARLLLPLLAVLQALHAYPVAGSQAHWSAFLLIPVGAICVADGVRGLNGALAGRRRRRPLLAVGAAAAAALMLVVVDIGLRQPWNEDRAAYDAGVPLDLPGARAVRLPRLEAQLYRQVATAIRRDCPALVMLPGMDSFYLWSGEEPPSDFNATAWPALFDASHQRRVIADTRSIRGLCLLENDQLALHWSPAGVPPGPLVRYLHRGFRPLAAFGEYRLLTRAGEGRS